MLVLVCAVLRLSIAGPDDLATGIRKYNELEFGAARERLERVIANPACSPADHQRALEYLARAHAALEQPALAKQRFEELLLLDPTFKISADESLRIRQAFGAARASLDERTRKLASAQAQAAPVSAQHERGSARHGTRGVRTVELAQSLSPGEVALGLGGEYFRASDVVLAGDVQTHQAERVFVAFSPLVHFDLSATFVMSADGNDSGLPRRATHRGDPSFGAKVSLPLGSRLGVGLGAEWLVPTGASGQALDPNASVLTSYAALSYAPSPTVLLAANARYRYDRTARLFDYEVTPVQRFSSGISDGDSFGGGVAAELALRAAPWLVVRPFLEANASFAQGLAVGHSPVELAAGGKLLLTEEQRFEIVLGGRARLSGEPRDDVQLAGVPPWEGFAALVGHFDLLAASRVRGGGVPTPTFVVAGRVTDQESGGGVANAKIVVSGFESTALTTDSGGWFVTWPLPVDEGLLRVVVEAGGYQPATQIVPRGPAGARTELTFPLRAYGSDVPGELRGALKSSRTGLPVRGQVFVPALELRVATDKDGAFSANLKPGRYQVIVTAPEHESQTKDILVKPGDVIILNADMVQKNR
jgi:hypothetical protein